jgi:hypothetical protein
MPLLDVSSVLLDPMFVTRGLICTRNTQVIDDSGIATNTPATSTFSGVVTNDTGDLLVRLAEGSRVQASITIHTRFKLQDGKTGLDADVITYKGNNYTITNVADWSDYGRGFVCASAELIPLSGGQPDD